MLIDKLLAINPDGVWRADVEAPANEAEFYANTYKWNESTGEWDNLTSSDVTWSQLDIEQVKAEKASVLTARYLWNFLSGMTSKHKLDSVAA